jgi:hypothetical protein
MPCDRVRGRHRRGGHERARGIPDSNLLIACEAVGGIAERIYGDRGAQAKLETVNGRESLNDPVDVYS